MTGIFFKNYLTINPTWHNSDVFIGYQESYAAKLWPYGDWSGNLGLYYTGYTGSIKKKKRSAKNSEHIGDY